MYKSGTMTPGRYLYTDPIGSPPEEVEVLKSGDQLAVRFSGMDVDAGEDIPLQHLAGEFQPIP